MGCCVSSKKKTKVRKILLSTMYKIIEPAIFIEENFKIIDHTARVKHLDIAGVKNSFLDYKATDFRCVKGEREGKHDHSHLIITFNHMLYGDIIDEIGLIINYSPYGFAITIGDIDVITKDCNLKSANIELLHLPKADNNEKVSISDVIDWAYEHKDEQYMDPYKIPEFNMGKRIYIHFVSMLSHKIQQYRI